MKKLLFSLVAGASIISFAHASGTLYVVSDTNNHELYSVNPTTMQTTLIGSLGIDASNMTFGDLTYDSANSTMYYSGGRGDNNLYTVNLTTGAATLVGSDGTNDLFALGYDNATNSLFGGTTNGSFGSVDAATGAFTLLGNNGAYGEGLTFNTTTNQLVLSDVNNLYSVNTTNGALTLLGSPGNHNDLGVTYDASTNSYWEFDYNGNLDQINGSTYQTISSNNLNIGDGSSIAIVPQSVPEPAEFVGLGLALLGLARRRK